jgi:hypothetical protein
MLDNRNFHHHYQYTSFIFKIKRYGSNTRPTDGDKTTATMESGADIRSK